MTSSAGGAVGTQAIKTITITGTMSRNVRVNMRRALIDVKVGCSEEVAGSSSKVPVNRMLLLDRVAPLTHEASLPSKIWDQEHQPVRGLKT